MILFKPMPKPEETNSLRQVNQARDKINEEFKNKESIILFDRGYEGFAFLLKGKSEEEIEALVKVTTDRIEQLFSSFDKIDFFGGIGQIENRLSSVYLSFLSANKAFSFRFFIALNRFIDYREAKVMQEDDINANAFNWNILENFFITGSKEEIPTFILRYIDNIGNIDKFSLSTKNHIVINAYLCALAHLKKHNLSTEALDNRKDELLENRIIQESLLRIFTTVFSEKSNSKPILPQIRKAQAYIQEHVRDYGISLNTVAEYVNMSPNYFSTVFAQETGRTFIEYITSIRIDKACELLGNTNLKTIDISLEVGYQDAHYFSTLFKKEVGLTPREYRNKVTENVKK